MAVFGDSSKNSPTYKPFFSDDATTKVSDETFCCIQRGPLMPQVRPISNQELAQIFSQHVLWQKSEHRYGKQADLSYRSFSGRDLHNFIRVSNPSHMKDIIFNGADFSKVKMRDFIFEDCQFSHATFSNSSLHSIEFNHCNLDHADFSNTNMQKCHFHQSSMDYTEFRRVSALSVQWPHNKMKDVNFSLFNSIGQEVHFIDNTVQHMLAYASSFNNVLFEKNHFKETNFMEATFHNARMIDCDLDKESDFYSCNIEDCQFARTKLPFPIYQTTFNLESGASVPVACDLRGQRIISEDLIGKCKTENIHMFTKSIRDSYASTPEKHRVKKALLDLCKTFQKQCEDYNGQASKRGKDIFI